MMNPPRFLFLACTVTFNFALASLLNLRGADLPSTEATPPAQSSEAQGEAEARAFVQNAEAKSLGVPALEAAKQFELPPGYSLQVVLSEPDIAEPVMIAFDGNGRMYVAEMRTYMNNPDGHGQMEPRSRVSRHEDTDGDGVFDKHTVFADNVLLPRTLLTLDDRVIIGETNTLDLFVYRDTDGDGVADEKKLWFEGGPRGGNLEHQPNGLLWALDNGIYSTYNGYRLRLRNDVVSKEAIPTNQGQWGITQDDFGKVWFVNAGQEEGPVHYQQHILYGRFSIEGEQQPDFTAVWPLGPTPDIQGGTFQLRSDLTLNHFTATCGQDIFRGDRLPPDIRGDLIFAEPAGRIVRRAKVTMTDGVTHLANVYDHSELIRTKDRLFRPVNTITAPDGTLYLVDMYRGVVQESAWTRPGSYLREQILKYNLQEEFGRGRIYRVVHQDFKPGPQPHLLDETPSQWVEHLSHPNGWWRDTAQKLLVIRGDKSVVPQLVALAQPPHEVKARLHALWTLEGLEALALAQIEQALHDREPEIRKAGLRLGEPYLKNGDNANLLADATALLHDADPTVVIQSLLSLKHAEVPNARELAKETAEQSKFAAVYAINAQAWVETTENPALLRILGAAGLKSYRDGRTFYNSLCFACHGENGKGTPAGPGRTLAPPLSHSPRVLESAEAMIDIVLSGLEGPLGGVDYGAPMVPMASYSDQQLADVLTYIRNSFDNRAEAVKPEQITTARKAVRPKFWTLGELETRHPVLKIPNERFARRSEWKLTASHSPATLPDAVDGCTDTSYFVASNPYQGIWLTVELPVPGIVKAIMLYSSSTPNAYPNTYDVRLSDDGKTWGAPVAIGPGEPTTQLQIPHPVSAKFIRITCADKTGWSSWAVDELEFYGEETK